LHDITYGVLSMNSDHSVCKPMQADIKNPEVISQQDWWGNLFTLQRDEEGVPTILIGDSLDNRGRFILDCGASKLT